MFEKRKNNQINNSEVKETSDLVWIFRLALFILTPLFVFCWLFSSNSNIVPAHSPEFFTVVDGCVLSHNSNGTGFINNATLGTSNLNDVSQCISSSGYVPLNVSTRTVLSNNAATNIIAYCIRLTYNLFNTQNDFHSCLTTNVEWVSYQLLTPEP